MTLSDHIALEVKAAVHAALDERELNAWPELMTLKEVEERYINASGEKVLKASTLRAAILSNQLKASQPGKEYLVSPEALRDYLELVATPSTAPMGVTDVRTRRT